jgi:hypothetical protein
MIKGEFSQFNIQLVLSQHLQHHAQMMLMLLYLGLDENVIKKFYEKIVQIMFEHSIHQAHKICWCIGQPKWHHYKLIMAILYPQGCLAYVFFL